jgi:hypothetical protein
MEKTSTILCNLDVWLVGPNYGHYDHCFSWFQILHLTSWCSKPHGFQRGLKANNSGKGELELISQRSIFYYSMTALKFRVLVKRTKNLIFFLFCVQALKLLSETLKHNGLPQLPGITSGDSAPGPGAADSSGGFLSGHSVVEERYCQARWIRLKLGSFDRSSLKREGTVTF